MTFGIPGRLGSGKLEPLPMSYNDWAGGELGQWWSDMHILRLTIWRTRLHGWILY